MLKNSGVGIQLSKKLVVNGKTCHYNPPPPYPKNQVIRAAGIIIIIFLFERNCYFNIENNEKRQIIMIQEYAIYLRSQDNSPRAVAKFDHIFKRLKAKSLPTVRRYTQGKMRQIETKFVKPSQEEAKLTNRYGISRKWTDNYLYYPMSPDIFLEKGKKVNKKILFNQVSLYPNYIFDHLK